MRAANLPLSEHKRGEWSRLDTSKVSETFAWKVAMRLDLDRWKWPWVGSLSTRLLTLSPLDDQLPFYSLFGDAISGHFFSSRAFQHFDLAYNWTRYQRFTFLKNGAQPMGQIPRVPEVQGTRCWVKVEYSLYSPSLFFYFFLSYFPTSIGSRNWPGSNFGVFNAQILPWSFWGLPSPPPFPEKGYTPLHSGEERCDPVFPNLTKRAEFQTAYVNQLRK